MSKRRKGFPLRDPDYSGDDHSNGGGSAGSSSRKDPLLELSGHAINRMRKAVEASGRLPSAIAARARVEEPHLEGLLKKTRRSIRQSELHRLARELGTYSGWVRTGQLTWGEQCGAALVHVMDEEDITGAQLSDRTAKRDSPLFVSEETIGDIRNGRTISPDPLLLTSLALACGRDPNATWPRKPAPPHETKPQPSLSAPYRLTPRALLVTAPQRRRPWKDVVLAALCVVGLAVFMGSDTVPKSYFPPTSFERTFSWNGEASELLAFDTPPMERYGSFVVRGRGESASRMNDLPRAQTERELAAIFGTSRNAHMIVKPIHTAYGPQLAELTGDDSKELVVVLTGDHDDSPAILRAFTMTGEAVVNYYVAGGIDRAFVDDFDGDNKDEILVGAWSIDEGFRGAHLIMLGAGRGTGAARDCVAIARSPVNDNALAWLQLPPFDAYTMSLMRGDRLRVWSIWRGSNGDNLSIVAAVGTDEANPVLVYVDDSLRPLRAELSDALRADMRSWSDADSLRFVTKTLPEWIEKAQYSSR